MIQKHQFRIRRRQSEQRSSFLQFEKTMFNIVNVATRLALRCQSRTKSFDDTSMRIMGTLHHPKKVNQLWILKYLSGEKYEIINYETDDVIDTDEDQVKLCRGKSKMTQKIEIQKIKNTYNEVRFKNYNGSYLTLDGILTLSKEKFYDDLQKFQLIPVNQPFLLKGLQDTYTIMRPPAYCLDVQNGTLTPGNHIILYETNNRGNQRWHIQPPLNQKQQEQKVGRSIRNFISQLYLSIDQKDNVCQVQKLEPIWVLEKDKGLQNQLQYNIFCLLNSKYLTSSEENKLVFRDKASQSKKWVIVDGSY